MVSTGLEAVDDEKIELSTIQRLSRSCERQFLSTTEVLGSVPATAVPHMWEFVAMPISRVKMKGKPDLRIALRTLRTNCLCAARLLRFQ
jgi:hypothetical protein